MLYINGREVLLGVQVGGTWSILSGTWTLPAFTMSGDISLGANRLRTTNLLLKEDNPTNLAIRNAADAAYLDLTIDDLNLASRIFGSAGSYLAASDADAGVFTFQARDTGVGLIEVARMVGAADPYFQMTLAMRLNPLAALPGTPVEGMLGYDNTDNQVKAYNGVSWLNLGGADYIRDVKLAGTRWVIPGWSAVTNLGVAVSAGRIYYCVIFVAETTTYIRIGVNVTVAAIGTADLRIFNFTNGLPGSLLLSAGTIDTNVLGANEIVIAQQLTRGYYVLAIRCSGAPSLTGLGATGVVAPFSGLSTSLGAVSPVVPILYVDAAYADPAPAPTAFANANYAFVRLREN